MKKIVFLGECMVELRALSAGTLGQSFAGDVYNSAVYLKRCFPAVTTAMATAVGQDTLSEQMVQRFVEEHIDTQFVYRHPVKAPGMYLIETDETGERSFTYWRSDAAARKIVDFLDADALSSLASVDVFFFSGISLAVIEPSAREEFWAKVQQLKQAGVKIIFDPNYRPRLWSGEDEAKEQFNQALQMSDVVMPGVEDFEVLYNVDSAEGVLAFCQQFQIEEIVVKNGPASVVTQERGATTSHAITPVANVVDTTSAGDAFNGAYLGARLCDIAVDEAVKIAAHAAGTVIQHPGAIAPKEAFKEAMISVGLPL